MASNALLDSRLHADKPLILDGAIGTELERLGAQMDDGVWCARALAECPHIVHRAYRRYIEAGADVITTNSFAATRASMIQHGLGEHFQSWNRLAARIAREERDRSARAENIFIAGSVSTYGSFSKLDIDTRTRYFRSQAELLTNEGVDLLILESLGSTVETVKAMIHATSDLGVPVWVSLSCVRNRDDGAVNFGIEESGQSSDVIEEYGPLDSAVKDIMAVGGDAVLMMHSVRDVTEDAVKVMRDAYAGPVGAYPNAGYWTRPNWTFVDQVTPETYRDDAAAWVRAGASIVGGCCGVGVEHIRAVAKALKSP